MLLTGFDAPILQTMYLDKPMKEHKLLQAIARTNRPYKDIKEAGLVIDYVGIDKNENGKIETKAYDTDKNGKLDTWAYDSDEDGKIDLYGLDNNEDGEIDEYVKA